MAIPVAWTEIYTHPLPVGHRFPMEKYSLIPQQLLYEGCIEQHQVFTPKPLSEQQILSTHNEDYWHKLKYLQLNQKEQRSSGFPLSAQLVMRERIICNGTLLGATMALNKTRCAFNVAGGTHHAYADRAEGFCLLNDIAIAANHLLQNTTIKQILVIDLDVHQGNGTAKIFENEPAVFTFSMHGEKNYPFKKETSNLDIPLPDGINDNDYLSLLRSNLARLFDEVNPEFVFFQAGVDILETDKLGKLGVTQNGCKARDEFVMKQCLNWNIPLQISMGGGYSPHIKNIIEAHANTFRLAMSMFE
ncbi:MAG: histone deacetylase [Salibacteraceae bacterium]